jgi:hypothetical protein
MLLPALKALICSAVGRAAAVTAQAEFPFFLF